LLAVLVAAVPAIDALLAPSVNALAEMEGRAMASSAVNAAVLETLEKEQLSYSDLALASTNDGGMISSISADTVRLNQLKAAVAANINARLDGLCYRKIELPLWNVLGFDFLLGGGPVIKARLKLHGESYSAFYSEFDSVGVNQTRHRIMLKVETKVYFFLKGKEDVYSFETQVCAAETVFAGAVPSVDLSQQPQS
jgi:sporulation protein YunB